MPRLRSVLTALVVCALAGASCKAPPGKGAFNTESGEPKAAALAITPETGTGSYAMPETRGDITKARHVPELDANVVYFGFDSSVIAGPERTKLEAVSAYFKQHPTEQLVIEGHCDERGTQEYNIALGERRAQACREYLIQNGLDAKRIQTISYGKEHPADPGHDDAAWSKNRRSEFLVD